MEHGRKRKAPLEIRQRMGAQLRRARRAIKGLSHSKVSGSLSLTQQSVSRTELGIHGIKAHRLWQYAYIYNTSISFLYGDALTPLPEKRTNLKQLPKLKGGGYSLRGYEVGLADYIGKRIIKQRIRKKVSRRALGEILSMSGKQIRLHERQTTANEHGSAISAFDLQLIADFLEVPVEDFYPPLDFPVEQWMPISS